ncbi:hypothetical protein [Herbiconiux sp. UC225_62]|uniref:hypothetical protein n=1 Tax=Herbiconiux sp. UC225_62 TaxID=3350168 RepID=UPI0036D274E8
MIGAILKATEGWSVTEYESVVSAFYREAKHLTLGTAYSGVVYVPMIELLHHLEDAGFTNYIVSGGDRDFMRPISQDYYASRRNG